VLENKCGEGNRSANSVHHTAKTWKVMTNEET
jgi:hypothetical protein